MTHIAAAIFIPRTKRRMRAGDDRELAFAQQVIQTAGYTDGAAIGSETPTNPAAPAPGHRSRVAPGPRDQIAEVGRLAIGRMPRGLHNDAPVIPLHQIAERQPMQPWCFRPRSPNTDRPGTRPLHLMPRPTPGPSAKLAAVIDAVPRWLFDGGRRRIQTAPGNPSRGNPLLARQELVEPNNCRTGWPVGANYSRDKADHVCMLADPGAIFMTIQPGQGQAARGQPIPQTL